MANKRNDRRFKSRCIAEFVLDDKVHKGIASDFSLSGMFIRTHYPPVLDSIFDVKLFLPYGKLAVLKVKVIRVIKPSMGKVMGIPTTATSTKIGVGVKILKKDQDYLDFIRALLG
ncbi:MAG: PilZ domain-containing protein [Nitrospirae bacterium]|nr:PilZ domain-containing protein [Nitrospirota bacterium]